jgi:hypothetical protein
MKINTRHKWGDKVRFPLANKSEQQCKRCDMVKVSRREYPPGGETYWTEFWRDLERVDDGSGATPPCDARLELVGKGG